MADLPSSRKNAGPCQAKKKADVTALSAAVEADTQRHLRNSAKMQVYPQETHLYPEASKAGNLDVRVAGQVGASDIVRTL